MYATPLLLKCITQQLILIFISSFMIICEGISSCPFIETLSFGSGIDIKCNKSYLIFNEINNERLSWKFANQSSICNQKGIQQASVNECGIRSMNSNYLRVPLKSVENNEIACVYCRINYKSIAPMITVTVNRSNHDDDGLYIFNITAIDLALNESFEILWAKRRHAYLDHSYNYWFLQECIQSSIEILINNPHTIVFSTHDISIDRVEFIVRRCNGTCRKYDKCPQSRASKEMTTNNFSIPDSIEKISCDHNCLNSIITPSSTSRLTTVPITTTTKKSSISEQKIRLIIIVTLLGVVIIIPLIILIGRSLWKTKGNKHVYAKTSNVDPDEHK